MLASSLGKRVYDLRDSCLTEWLNQGIPPAQVAYWAGNSVAVLHARYERVVEGPHSRMLALLASGVSVAGPPTG